MGERISDAQVVAVLRPFVRAASLLVDGLRDKDPFSVLAREAENPVIDEPKVRDRVLHGLNSMKVPGTVTWSRMGVDARVRWWKGRVGRVTSLVAAVPGIAGVLANRFPVQATLGAAGQGLLLCALAGERGHTDVETRVRLIASVLFEREISAEVASGRESDRAAEDAETEWLTEDLDGRKDEQGKRRRPSIVALGTSLWRLGRTLLDIPGELDKRPHGRWIHRMLGNLPVVGMLGKYLGERSGLKRIAARADRWFTKGPGAELDPGA
ncbi:hypothetical protein BJF85_23605 [Saccharomonospora sp. CUA-673]|uniref:hypothetical protein n=1 Tax=Saccharomonospora sp. CUA-673 TaxID=1904969 RepID=UPI00095C2EFF|nr:hypothetical protein [Saccharomonospora sp. CUA-673]OLT42065.1 hypothetical protein BJF85_23605 [Saccharomonospora sp. CUA-673]